MSDINNLNKTTILKPLGLIFFSLLIIWNLYRYGINISSDYKFKNSMKRNSNLILHESQKDLIGILILGHRSGFSHDAKNVLNMFQAIGLGINDIKVLYTGDDSNTMQENLDKIFHQLHSNLEFQDKTIICYSGHGTEYQGHSSLIIGDGEKSIDDDYFYRKLKDLPGKKIVIINSCRAGGFLDKLKNLPLTTVIVGSTNNVSLSEMPGTNSFITGFTAAIIKNPNIPLKDAFEDGKKGTNNLGYPIPNAKISGDINHSLID